MLDDFLERVAGPKVTAELYWVETAGFKTARPN